MPSLRSWSRAVARNSWDPTVRVSDLDPRLIMFNEIKLRCNFWGPSLPCTEFGASCELVWLLITTYRLQSASLCLNNLHMHTEPVSKKEKKKPPYRWMRESALLADLWCPSAASVFTVSVCGPVVRRFSPLVFKSHSSDARFFWLSSANLAFNQRVTLLGCFFQP